MLLKAKGEKRERSDFLSSRIIINSPVKRIRRDLQKKALN